MHNLYNLQIFNLYKYKLKLFHECNIVKNCITFWKKKSPVPKPCHSNSAVGSVLEEPLYV